MAEPLSPAPAPDAALPSPEETAEDRVMTSRMIDLDGRTLREHTARGTVINAAFLVAVSALGLLRGFIVAAFLTRTDYGIWGILIVGLGTLSWLKQVGISDKYIQQSDEDQEEAFHKAFTLELIFSGAFFVLIVAAVPLLAVIYGQPEIVAPGLVMALIVPAYVLQVPIWVYYRRMDFMRQRLLQSVEPIAAFVITIGLAIAGAGYWSLVVGAVAGGCFGAVVALRASPYKLALRYDRGTARQYLHFSWPLFAGSVGSLVVAQGAYLIGNAAVGLAGVGAIALAATIAQFAERVDQIVTGTLYPAICAVRDRAELLYESFVKSNRLALMWGMPFGLGVALFAPDLITYGIGERWRSAEVLIQVFGVAAAVNQIGFNWDAYFRALDRTRPIAVVNGVSAVVFLAVAAPLMLSDGLDGFAIGMAIVAVANVGARAWFLGRLFQGFDIARYIARAVVPSVPAVAVVLAARAVEGFDRSLPVALGELALYLAVTAAATYLFERSLVREALGYLRGRSASTAPAPV
jgi:polysaccharide transporter, PST family